MSEILRRAFAIFNGRAAARRPRLSPWQAKRLLVDPEALDDLAVRVEMRTAGDVITILCEVARNRSARAAASVANASLSPFLAWITRSVSMPSSANGIASDGCFTRYGGVHQPEFQFCTDEKARRRG